MDRPGFFKKLRQRVYRYDYFVSYAQHDASSYALALQEALVQRGFHCFIDRRENPAGEPLRPGIHRALRRTTALILVATPAALRSPHVREELTTFANWNRPRIPIDIGNTLVSVAREHPVRRLLGDAVWTTEPAGQPAVEPSAGVLDDLTHSFRYRREGDRRVRILASTSAVLLVLAVAAAGFGGLAEARRKSTVLERNRAIAGRLAAQAELLRNQRGRNLELSLLLAVKSMEIRPTLEAEQALRRGLGLLPRWRADLEHDATVEGPAFPPAASGWLVTAGRRARVWSTESWTQRFAIEAPRPTVSFAASDERLATADATPEVVVWATSDGRMLERLGHEAPARRVLFNSAGDRLAVVLGADAIHGVDVWEVEGWQRVARFRQEAPVRAVVFDGVLLASAADRLVYLYSLDEEEPPRRLEHRGSIAELAFSPDRSLLAVAIGDVTETANGVHFWETETGEKAAFWPHPHPVETLAFGRKGRLLAAGGGFMRLPRVPVVRPATVAVWDVVGRMELRRLAQEAAVRTVAFSPDGVRLATAGLDNTARVWQVESGRELWRMPHPAVVESLAFTPDGSALVVAGRSSLARVWTLEGEAWAASVHGGIPVQAVAASPDGEFLATAAGQYTGLPGVTFSGSQARFWHLGSRWAIHDFHHDAAVEAVAFSPAGTYLATAGRDRIARVWPLRDPPILELRAARPEVMRAEHEDAVTAVGFRGEESLLTASLDGTVKAWRLPSGELDAVLEHGAAVVDLSLALNVGRAATITAERAVFLWDLATREQLLRIELPDAAPAVALSPDGRHLVTFGPGFWQLWKVGRSGNLRELLRRAPVHDGAAAAFLDAVFSPDGGHLATGGDDGVVRVWTVPEGREVARMHHTGSVFDVAFRADGRYIASASGDRTARLWLWRPEDLRAEACLRLSRDLSVDEWRQYLPGEPFMGGSAKLRGTRRRSGGYRNAQ